MASDSYYISEKNEKAMQRNPNKLDTEWTYFVSILIISGSVIWLFYKDITNLWAILGIVGGMMTVFSIRRIKTNRRIISEIKKSFKELENKEEKTIETQFALLSVNRLINELYGKEDDRDYE